jgi:hypothetical protein
MEGEEGRKKERRKEKREIQMGFTVQLSGIFSTPLQSLSVYLSKDCPIYVTTGSP